MERSRYPKRRRVSSTVKDKAPRVISPLKDKIPVRFSSPDELAANSEHEYFYAHRTPSHLLRDCGDRGRRYSTAATSRESPDELDHTVGHAADHTVDHTIHHFYRGSFSKKAREPPRAPHDRSPTRSPPPYSRISTPIESPRSPPIRPPQYVPYKQKMVLKGHRKGVAAVSFSPDGRLIASCCEFAILQSNKFSSS